jgi:hypothetical protein
MMKKPLATRNPARPFFQSEIPPLRSAQGRNDSQGLGMIRRLTDRELLFIILLNAVSPEGDFDDQNN